MHVKLQPTYVLHSRPYRDSSQMLDVLTAEFGRMTVVAKGARRRQRGGAKVALLQPFNPLLLSFSGRSEMKNLTATEVAGKPLVLRGKRLFSGFYLNELLVRLLHRHDPHPVLFLAYSDTLKALAGEAQVDELLRRFEFTLLQQLGFGFELAKDGETGECIEAKKWYRFDSECGLVQVNAGNSSAAMRVGPTFLGRELLAMSTGEFGVPVRATAKHLLRQALTVHLGDKPLKSRDLFRAHRRDSDINRH